MIIRPYIVSMARYNQWMNDKVYAAAARLPAEEIARDRGAFFKSILGTLNHLRYADLIWMGRFKEGKPRISEPVADLVSLHAARVELDREILEWAATVDEAWLGQSFTFRTVKGDAEFTNPCWVLVVNMFNHQTHHRGQITTLLTQAGEDVGPTDFSAMPGVGEHQ